MEDENVNNDLNSGEFSDFMGKYKDYFDKNKPNHNDLSFLDRKEHPSDEEVIEFFITEDDINNGVDIANYDLKELGVPNAIKSLEGTEWRVSKLVWFKPEGRIISFALIKTGEYFDMLDDPTRFDNLNNKEWEKMSIEIIDTDHEEVEPDNYIDALAKALEDEDYTEAARLRDWYKTLNEMIAQVYNFSNNGHTAKLLGKLDEINNHKGIL